MNLCPRTVELDGTATVLGAVTFPRHVDQVPHARDWVVKSAFSGRTPPTGDGLDSLQLCASEVVTNAVRYGDAGDWLGVVVIERGPCAIRIEVIDQGNSAQRAPLLPAEGVDEPELGGRGLRIVAAYSTDWGHRRDGHGSGHVVWFDIQYGDLDAT